MNKFLKWTLILFGVIVLGIAILVFSFLQSMKPDSREEEKARILAEEYVEDTFNRNFEINDILYDNMGNFNFEYGAKVRDNKNNITFFVYYSEVKEKVVDTYIANKWADELEDKIRPYIKEKFGQTIEFDVYYADEIGEELGIESANPGSYKDFNVAPTIRFAKPHKKSESDGDEKNLNEFIAFLQSEDILHQGTVIADYVPGNQSDMEWFKDFGIAE